MRKQVRIAEIDAIKVDLSGFGGGGKSHLYSAATVETDSRMAISLISLPTSRGLGAS